MADAQPVLVRQCLDQTFLHEGLESFQVVAVNGELVVFRQPLKPLLVDVDDVGIGVVEQVGIMDAFAIP